MRWFVYEDQAAPQLYPIALLRPAFELVCGRESLRRRLQRWFPGAEWGACVRSWLAPAYAEEQPEAIVNDFVALQSSPVLMVNGRWMPAGRLQLQEVSMDNAGYIDGHLAWIALEQDEAQLLTDDDYAETLLGIARTRRVVEASGTMITRPWDLVSRNGRQLELDFADEGLSQPSSSPHVQCLGDERDVYISEQAEIDPYVVIDTRTGPVSIDRDVHIQSFTRIEGPCHISRGARVFRALIHHGTTIGPECRVGGEIEESILHSHVNKYHEGFLGHSYVCPWVNLGAITTTSDLKSDYSNVAVPLQGELVDSGLTKVGSFIGDHTKTAIDSMFNTGSSIGVMTLVLPGGRLLPRHIPSFCNISFGAVAANWPLEQGLHTARMAMQRRGCVLTATAEELLRRVYEMTADERLAAVNLAAQKRIHRS
jgi:UDP-N-acetylglucosamine diphosphorylase / glucose-1-phosphate thymidylyltransferase / UDP-N-acetylgalactosamine diphosphorylase / glucosamine-1-phosphate N-acetyltransferase / galactosamine-1-phosphate N-acetyltransferase